MGWGWEGVSQEAFKLTEIARANQKHVSQVMAPFAGASGSVSGASLRSSSNSVQAAERGGPLTGSGTNKETLTRFQLFIFIVYFLEKEKVFWRRIVWF